MYVHVIRISVGTEYFSSVCYLKRFLYVSKLCEGRKRVLYEDGNVI